MPEELRIERDDPRGVVTVFAGEHEIVGWRFGAEHAFPHWFPLKSPSGKDLLIQHPDPYPHHRALWIADKVQLGDGPVVDFYHCVPNQHDSKDPGKGYRHFMRQTAGPVCAVRSGVAVVAVALQWLVNGTTPVLDDAREFTVTSLGGGEVLLDLSWTLRAAHGPVTFHSDQVHYAWPYLRVHPQFSVDRGGALVDDVGRTGQKATNEKHANWMDNSGTVDGATEGVAVFLPQDGQWRKWLTRDYGCFGPRRPDHRSGHRFVLGRGEELGGEVRIFVHRGDAATGGVAR
ncbi:MAG: hypothetical protein FJ265_17535, partial [Planctomycetes bacterium]|nr:hypothetical protein [Planctomycetota bacterium]